MSKAIAVIDEALSATWLTQPQRNVLAIFREQVSDYHAQRNPLLFGSDAWIGQHVMTDGVPNTMSAIRKR